MNKEFLPYNESLELKALGFDEPCFGYYDNASKLYYNTNGQPVEKDWVWVGNQILPTDMILAPTFSQAFRWLYQKLDIKKGVMPLDIESQQLLLKELIDKVSSKRLLV